MKLLKLLNKKNIEKSFLYIRNHGFGLFLKKAKGKLREGADFQADSSAAICSLADIREKRLAEAYIKTVAKDPNTFVDLISPDDEMYIFVKNNIGQKDTASYLYFKSGREALQCIDNIVRFSVKSFGGIRSFLDFACGYGKSTRFLIQEIEPRKVWVSDIYREAVNFQKKYFGVKGFYFEPEPSKLKFSRKFEVIYVGSLFSHLPANLFEEWLFTLYNVLEDDGILIFSTHGESLCPAGFQADPSGFTFLKFSESRSLSAEDYGSTFVTREWVERLCEKLGIMNIYFLEKELWGSQDIYVIPKRDIPSLKNLRPNSFPQGNLESIKVTQDGDILVRGWAIDKEFGAPVKEVSIYVDDEFLGNAALRIRRPDVADHFKRTDYLDSGWQCKGQRLVLGNKEAARNAGFLIIKASIKDHGGHVTYLFSSYEAALCQEQKQYAPPGHFFSPIPSLGEIKENEENIFRIGSNVIPSIELNEENQLKLFEVFKEFYAEIPFKDTKQQKLRYFFENPSYPYSDAIVLYCMIRHAKPQRIIEVGSGYSSCVILDTNEIYFDNKIQCTFIEPYPQLLESLITRQDKKKVEIVPKRLQDIELSYFKSLHQGDILFIDSTHVAKINSDVNYIFFQILPSLNSGIYIHFHDIFYPFEYPKEWIYEGRAWNEDYLLRAFLQYNHAFEIIFFNTFLEHFHEDKFRRDMPLCMKNRGGSIWIRKR